MITSEKVLMEKRNYIFCETWESNPRPLAQQPYVRVRGRRTKQSMRLRLMEMLFSISDDKKHEAM